MSDTVQPEEGRREISRTVGGSDTGEGSLLMGSNPPPIPNNSKPIVDEVVEDILTSGGEGADRDLIQDFWERKRFGIEKYGVALQAKNGRNYLLDAYEESLDQAIYLRGYISSSKKAGADLTMLYAASLEICRYLRRDLKSASTSS